MFDLVALLAKLLVKSEESKNGCLSRATTIFCFLAVTTEISVPVALCLGQ